MEKYLVYAWAPTSHWGLEQQVRLFDRLTDAVDCALKWRDETEVDRSEDEEEKVVVAIYTLVEMVKERRDRRPDGS